MKLLVPVSWRAPLLLFAASQLAVAQQQGTAAQTQRAPLPLSDPRAVQLGVRVQPDTVTVGDRFTVFVRVRAPVGSTIAFPAGPDSGTVELVTNAAFTEPRVDSLWVEQTAGYRLAAWDVDSQPLPFPDVVVRSGSLERRVPVGARSIFVRSVLPADTTLHVPKPARELFAFGIPRWLLWLLAALLALLLALLAWWLWRKLRRREQLLPPFERAEREFERIEALQLPEHEEGARHVAMMTDVLREYLAARIDGVSSSQTGWELLRAMRVSEVGDWDASMQARAERLFARADLAKFAAVRIPPDEARTLGAEARALVGETERRITSVEESSPGTVREEAA
ncbi:MAG TPA: hypothetical protein VMM17_05850 [Gemmatimonadaceae bacterium]|nr:hypothetical protein [Gemmatimonadaceae bacterium]